METPSYTEIQMQYLKTEAKMQQEFEDNKIKSNITVEAHR